MFTYLYLRDTTDVCLSTYARLAYSTRKCRYVLKRTNVEKHLRVRFRRTINIHGFIQPTTWPEPPNHLIRRQDLMLAQASAPVQPLCNRVCANNIAARTISGRWATPVHAVHAVKFMWTESVAEMLQTSSVCERVRSLLGPR